MFKILAIFGTIFLVIINAQADDLISAFPIKNYDQKISDFINPKSGDYHRLLLSHSQQKKRLKEFYSHYYSSNGTDKSPWNKAYINLFYKAEQPYDIKSTELLLIKWLSNKGKAQSDIGYSFNFLPYTNEWINSIQYNMNIAQFTGLNYHSRRRAIAITNLAGRALPTDDPHFYSFKQAGQGYPFDNIQVTSVWAGTPIYIAGMSRDGKWYLVITPNVMVWVHSDGIAYADNNFISAWQKAAHKKLAAITETGVSVFDQKQKRFCFTAYVGSIFPLESTSKSKIKIMIPIMYKNHMAKISTAILHKNEAKQMPLAATPRNFAKLIETMQGRPYGWGGYTFYNDCSIELKSLLTPFGIYVMQHSSDQIRAGKVVDLTNSPPKERISYLAKNGHKFMTIVYVGGHIFLYIGNTIHYGNRLVPMTYQSIWGLAPADKSRRSIIGKTVLFPLLEKYSEDPHLLSLAGKRYFKVSFLDD
jgi:SH3 domain (SH3b1 type)/NLPC_P60 stabilising domain, N term/SH3 domain of SH3b2 type